jgi:hypothetical protein
VWRMGCVCVCVEDVVCVRECVCGRCIRARTLLSASSLLWQAGRRATEETGIEREAGGRGKAQG